MHDTPMYQLYQRVRPRPEDFPRLLTKIGEAMSKDFDFTEEVRGLQMPTLVVAADADMAPPSHYVEVSKLLGGRLRDGGWMGEGRPKVVTRSRSGRRRQDAACHRCCGSRARRISRWRKVRRPRSGARPEPNRIQRGSSTWLEAADGPTTDRDHRGLTNLYYETHGSGRPLILLAAATLAFLEEQPT